jgi:hypothetical protein
MQHCPWNIKKILSAQMLSLSNPARYKKFLAHAATCKVCSAKLKELQETQELERFAPKHTKPVFVTEERRRR